MDHLRPFTFFVVAPGGAVNLLLCTACNLIPVVGQVALLGYRSEVADELVRDRRLRRHPAFDFGRFGVYLRRGIGPAAYQLLFALLAGTAVVGGAWLASVGLDRAAGTADPYPWAAVVLLGWAGATLGVTVAAAGLLWPMELHAQLSGRIAPLAAAGFAVRFQGRMWGQSLVSLLLFVLAGGLLNLLGLLACLVGVYATVVVQFLAQQHLMTQLYNLYLDDGCEPIHEAGDG